MAMLFLKAEWIRREVCPLELCCIITRILSEALSHAVKMGLLGRNVADAVEPPRPECNTMVTLVPEDGSTFLEAAKGTSYYVLFYTALYTGMRLGTLDTYSHVLPGLQEAAAKRFDELLELELAKIEDVGKMLAKNPELDGEPHRTRTCNRLIKSQLLYLLS